MVKTFSILFFLIFSVVSYGDTFIRDDNKKIVVDNKHQLMWQDSEKNKENALPKVIIDPSKTTFQEAPVFKTNMESFENAVEYCESLSHAGFDDWRLPKRMELLYITDRTRFLPAINQNFKNVSSMRYWSSSLRSIGGGTEVWLVNFDNGSTAFQKKHLLKEKLGASYYEVTVEKKHTLGFVRCVRNMQ